MSEFDDLTGRRDYRTPLPMTGKPYTKTYYDWVHRRWRTEVCILLGARETPPGVPYGETPEGRGRGQAPDRERKDLSPQGQRQVPVRRGSLRSDSLRSRIRQVLREKGQATTAEIRAALPDADARTISASLGADSTVIQVAGRRGTGRAAPGESAVWVLAEVQS